MLSTSQLVALGALLHGSMVAGIVFSGPKATPVVDGAWTLDAHGWTPKPTDAPRFAALARRQKGEDDMGFCGYAEGDPERIAHCTNGACLLDTILNWFGCCTGTVITDCGVATGCVPSASIGACLDDPECYGDPLLTACSERASPYCAYLYTETAGSSFGHFECAPEPMTVEIVASSTNGGGDDKGGERTRSEDWDDNGGRRTRTEGDDDIFSIQTDTVLEETSLLRPSRTRGGDDDSSTEDGESVVTITRTASPTTTDDATSTDAVPTTTSSQDAGNSAFRVGVVEVLVAAVVVLGA